MVNTQSRITSLRAIEALRAGVPNRDAVQALGSSQPVVEKRFKQMLTQTLTQTLSETLSENFLTWQIYSRPSICAFIW